jgi:hypothetical protein
MKSFFQFLNEAAQSQASMQAHKLGLVSDGHGGWKNKSGEYVAKTEKGKLKFFNQRQKVGEKDPDQVRTPANQQVAATQVKPPSEPPKKQQKKEDEPEEQPTGESQTLTVVFGRFNPPTVGHEKLLKSADRISTDGDLLIFPSRTQDPKKNPLDPDMKISYMKKMFPEYEDYIVNDPNMKSIFDVLVAANERGYGNINIVVGSDRQSEFDNLAQKYNGDLYDFDMINVVSAGVRDADAEGVEGMSASKMRKAVMDDDFESFRKGTPKKLDDGNTQALFNAVRQGMGAKKKKKVAELWQIAPKYDVETLRENYIRGKIFRIGDVVENLNTGLVGKVMRRGTNYLICVTEEGYMFKSWIRDLMEYSEVKMEKKIRVSRKPNTLEGTGGYFKYAVDMTPGFEKGDKTNLQTGAKPYIGYKQIKEFINKYKVKK